MQHTYKFRYASRYGLPFLKTLPIGDTVIFALREPKEHY